jgi:hypothetical protein
MKKLILLVLVLGISFAWTNDALPSVLNSEYKYTECNVKFAHDVVETRAGCADASGDTFPDLSGNLERIDSSMESAKSAAETGNGLVFGTAMFSARAEMLGLAVIVVGDAFGNKSSSFRSCALADMDAMTAEMKSCQSGAFKDGKSAATSYVGNEIEYGNSQIDELDALGADTSGMKKRVQQGEELKGDIASGYDSENVKEVTDLYSRHSRIILLFRLEKMVAVIDYAKPIIEAGNNTNKAELLEEMSGLKGDTTDLIDECEYSSTVDAGYANKNAQCWTEGLSLIERFNALYTLYFAGV